MISTDEEALICDFAQVYHIYDYQSLPADYVGTLAVGLPDNSRIKRKLAGLQVSLETLLLSIIADKLSFIAWSKTKDAEKGKNRPTSITSKLLGKEEKATDVMSFDSPEEFEKARQRLLNGE